MPYVPLLVSHPLWAHDALPPGGRGVRRGRIRIAYLSQRYDVDISVPKVVTGGWHGMSGAALFGPGRVLLGVVIADPVRYGSARLHALPVRRLLGDPAFAQLIGPVDVEEVEDRGRVTDLDSGSYLQPPYLPVAAGFADERGLTADLASGVHVEQAWPTLLVVDYPDRLTDPVIALLKRLGDRVRGPSTPPPLPRSRRPSTRWPTWPRPRRPPCCGSSSPTWTSCWPRCSACAPRSTPARTTCPRPSS
ncbi:hypothetical protein ACIBHX_24260 [Nonomuraea sp. NPDC050536]|uniref:hypothetical protein n=1 Tax=Nonomuraea sp. NPDC050536 TaxID=3364366 RepID=UPI0037C9DC94